MDFEGRQCAGFACAGRAPPWRRRGQVTLREALDSERMAGGSWRGAGLQQQQPPGGGQFDRAPVGLDERDAEQARAAAMRTGRQPGFGRRGFVTQYVTNTAALPGDGCPGLGISRLRT